MIGKMKYLHLWWNKQTYKFLKKDNTKLTTCLTNKQGKSLSKIYNLLFNLNYLVYL